MLMISVDLSVELQLYAVFKLFCLPKDPQPILSNLLYIVFIKSPDINFFNIHIRTYVYTFLL